MSRSIACLKCGASLRTPDNLSPTAKVRCIKCSHIFVAGEAFEEPSSPSRSGAIRTSPAKKPAPPLRDDDPDEEERPASRSGAIRKSPPPARPVRAVVRDVDEENEEDAEPIRKTRGKQKSAGNHGLIFALAGGGVALVALAVVLILVLNQDKPAQNQSAQNPPSNPQPPGPGPGPGPINPGNPGGNTAGTLSDDVLQKVKQATVFIKVETPEGGGSGSGFYIHNDLVTTNAHVLGMERYGAPLPTRVEVFINPGEANERKFPAEVVSVDSSTDLAVVRVLAPNGFRHPQPLSLVPSSGLKETQAVYVAGFPFGERVGKNVTITATTVTALRKDRGELVRVQVKGGMQPGNSGGPVVDERGNLVGVSVSIIRGTEISFAIPTEHVSALLRGRVSESSIGDPYRKGADVVVRVILRTLDPLGVIRQTAVDWWYGDAGQPRPPANVQPPLHAGDGQRQTTILKYNARENLASAELILTAPPPPGKVLWYQPRVIGQDGRERWLAAVGHALRPPIDPRPATIAYSPQVGRSRLRMQSSTRYEYRDSDGESHSFDLRVSTQLFEDVVGTGNGGVVNVDLNVADRFVIDLSRDGERPPEFITRRMNQISQDVGKMSWALTLKPNGEVASKSHDVSRLPPASQLLLSPVGEQLTESVASISIPLPGSQVPPGYRWTQNRVIPIETLTDVILGKSTINYIYRGVRVMPDRKEYAVIDVEGKLDLYNTDQVKLGGTVAGEVLYDLKEKRITEAVTIIRDGLELKFQGEWMRMTGTLETRMSRGPITPLPRISVVREKKRFLGLTRTVGTLGFSPDGKYLAASGHQAADLIVWDVSNGEIVRRFRTNPFFMVNAFSFSRDGKYLAYANGMVVDGQPVQHLARVIDLQTKERGTDTYTTFTGHQGVVRSIVMLPQGGWVASGGDDRQIRIWTAADGQLVRTLSGHRGSVVGLSVSADGSRLVSVGTDGVAVWDPNTGKRLSMQPWKHRKALITPDGKKAISVDMQGVVHLWEVDGMKPIKKLPGHNGDVPHLSLSADGKVALTAGVDRTIRLWDLVEGKELKKSEQPEGFGTVLLAPDGRHAASITHPNDFVRYLELPR